MGIDVPDPDPRQAMQFNEVMKFLIRCDRCLRQISQRTQDTFAIPQMSKRDLTHDERMPQHATGIKESSERRVGGP